MGVQYSTMETDIGWQQWARPCEGHLIQDMNSNFRLFCHLTQEGKIIRNQKGCYRHNGFMHAYRTQNFQKYCQRQYGLVRLVSFDRFGLVGLGLHILNILNSLNICHILYFLHILRREFFFI